MNLLTAVLKDLHEYQSLREAVENGQVACLSGLGTVHRAHILSALRQDTGRPLAIVCQDEETARRTIRELQSFSKEVPAFLPTRELTLYDASTVSRGWEQKRLRVLYGLGQGKIPVLVTSVEALMLRTVPRQTLFSATLLCPHAHGRGRGSVLPARRNSRCILPGPGRAHPLRILRRHSRRHGLL